MNEGTTVTIKRKFLRERKYNHSIINKPYKVVRVNEPPQGWATMGTTYELHVDFTGGDQDTRSFQADMLVVVG